MQTHTIILIYYTIFKDPKRTVKLGEILIKIQNKFSAWHALNLLCSLHLRKGDIAKRSFRVHSDGLDPTLNKIRTQKSPTCLSVLLKCPKSFKDFHLKSFWCKCWCTVLPAMSWCDEKWLICIVSCTKFITSCVPLWESWTICFILLTGKCMYYTTLLKNLPHSFLSNNE